MSDIRTDARTAADTLGALTLDSDARKAATIRTFAHWAAFDGAAREWSALVGLSKTVGARVTLAADTYFRLGGDDAAAAAVIRSGWSTVKAADVRKAQDGAAVVTLLKDGRKADAARKQAAREAEAATRAARPNDGTDAPNVPDVRDNATPDAPTPDAPTGTTLAEDAAAVAHAIGMLAARVKADNAFDAKGHEAIVKAVTAYTKAIRAVG